MTIQRHGVFNPYTGRGAIKGLLPHGPHNVRDVLATHILKQTGSYEQASYAIQDTPDTVTAHSMGAFSLRIRRRWLRRSSWGLGSGLVACQPDRTSGRLCQPTAIMPVANPALANWRASGVRRDCRRERTS